MSRTIAEYEELIDGLETSAASNPTWYRRKVVALAILGFTYIGFVVTLASVGLLALAAMVIAAPGFVTIKLGLVAGVPLFYLAWGSFKALRVPFPPPEGERLDPSDHPELFTRIEQIRSELDGPKVHEVVLVGELNAAIVGIPRLGILGWHKNYLILGLELLATLSDEEFDSVIAHEMGHLSGEHGKISGWIYRLRRTWFQLAENVAVQGGPSFAYRRFFDWFIPYFGAYSFVLARMHEYEADAAAAQVTSREVAGRALCRVEAAAAHLSSVFWPRVRDGVQQTDEPPPDVYRTLQLEASKVRDGLATSYVESALSRRPGLDDTHPSLRQRLESLGVEPVDLEPVEQLAGETYFGEAFAAKLDEYSERWAMEVAEQWSLMHAMMGEGTKRLDELRARRDAGEQLSTEDQLTFAHYLALFDEEDEALALYRQIVHDDQNNAAAHFQLGESLIARGDATGIDHLDRAMELDRLVTLEACDLIVGYFFEHGERTDAQPWVDRADVFREEMIAAQQERQMFYDKDTVMPPTVDDEVIDEITAALVPWEGQCRVYFVEKVVEHLPELPLYILAVEKTLGPIKRSAASLVAKELVQVELPVDAVWLDIGENSIPKLAKKIRKLAPCRII